MDWYKRYPASYRGDTWGLTLAEHGAYNLLLDHYYLTERPLPTGDAALASICGVTIEVWLTVKESVTRHFAVNNALMRHHKCDEVIDAALSKRTGTLSRQKAFVKRLKEKESVTRYERVNNIPRGEERREEEKDSPLPPKGGLNGARVVRQRRGDRLPTDWKPSSDLRDYAIAHGVDPGLAAEEFTNYWHAATKNAAKLDWDKTFKNRILELQHNGKFKRTGVGSSVVATGPRSPPPDWDEAREGPWRPPVS